MSTIDETKQKTDIVEIVSEHVPGLKKAGRNFKAHCPFHSEKTPSFYVFPERQSWHCFGACATGGDVFSFIMKKEGVDFGEALRFLAQRAGVSLAAPGPMGKNESETQRLAGLNRSAAEYYHRLLLDSPAAEGARGYLAQRGLDQKVMEDFQLGFSLDSWEALRGHLIELGYQEEELVAGGLVIKKESGGSYDRFRNRLMFPIQDAAGTVLGFGARALDDSSPKYLNSPQTSLFDKGAVLYGIDQAKDAVKRQDLVIVVEGYMDVIAAHQHGFKNVVASMGTSFTEKQASVLKKLTKNLVFALDADAAGATATGRGIEVAESTFDQRVVPVLTPRGMVNYENTMDAEVKVIVLPPGTDPDEIIRKSPEDWQGLVGDASPVVDYALQAAASNLDLTKPGDKSEAARRLQPVIETIKDPIRRAHYIQRLARILRVDQRFLAEAFDTARRPRSKARRMARTEPSSPVFGLPSGDAMEEYCLSLLFRYPALRSCADELSADYFDHSENRELLLAWRADPDLDTVRNGLETSLREHLEILIQKTLPPMRGGEPEGAMLDCIRRLRERWLINMKVKESLLISEAESAVAEGAQEQYDQIYLHGGAADVRELQQQAVRLNSQLGEVFSRRKKGRR